MEKVEVAAKNQGEGVRGPKKSATHHLGFQKVTALFFVMKVVRSTLFLALDTLPLIFGRHFYLLHSLTTAEYGIWEVHRDLVEISGFCPVQVGKRVLIRIL